MFIQENVLKKGRWLILKRPENLSEKQTSRLGDLLKLNLSSIKAYLLREDFQQFWEYHSYDFADKFLESGVTRTLQTDLEPMKKVARMLRNHKLMVLSWFKAKLTIRKVPGFKSIKCLQVALHHTLGELPEPCIIHRFCLRAHKNIPLIFWVCGGGLIVLSTLALINREFRAFIAFEGHPENLPNKDEEAVCLSRLSRKWTFRPLDLMVSQRPLSG